MPDATVVVRAFDTAGLPDGAELFRSLRDSQQLVFIPHGGLLHADYRPKQAYERLARLLAEWRRVP